MAAAFGIRMKSPAHPGGFVKHEVIEALNLTVTEAAHVLGVTRAALLVVLNERARLYGDHVDCYSHFALL